MEDLEFYKTRVQDLTRRVNDLNAELQTHKMISASAAAQLKFWRYLYLLSCLSVWLWFFWLSKAFHF